MGRVSFLCEQISRLETELERAMCVFHIVSIREDLMFLRRMYGLAKIENFKNRRKLDE